MFRDSIKSDCRMRNLLDILCDASEYDELPVRHNEDKINADLAEEVKKLVKLASHSLGALAS